MKIEKEFAYMLLSYERTRMASELGSDMERLSSRDEVTENSLWLQMMLERVASLDRAMAILEAW